MAHFLLSVDIGSQNVWDFGEARGEVAFKRRNATSIPKDSSVPSMMLIEAQSNAYTARPESIISSRGGNVGFPCSSTHGLISNAHSKETIPMNKAWSAKCWPTQILQWGGVSIHETMAISTLAYRRPKPKLEWPIWCVSGGAISSFPDSSRKRSGRNTSKSGYIEGSLWIT